MAERIKKKTARKSAAGEKTRQKKSAKGISLNRQTPKKSNSKAENKNVSGYGLGGVDVVMSVDQVAKEAASIAASAPAEGELQALVEGELFLSIDNLCAGYGKMEILHDYSLRIGQGQSLCLIGPNGAGKSTFVKLVYGLLQPDEGEIFWQGQPVNISGPLQARQLGIQGVPFYILDGQYAISGAQEPEAFHPLFDMLVAQRHVEENEGLNSG